MRRKWLIPLAALLQIEVARPSRHLTQCKQNRQLGRLTGERLVYLGRMVSQIKLCSQIVSWPGAWLSMKPLHHNHHSQPDSFALDDCKCIPCLVHPESGDEDKLM